MFAQLVVSARARALPFTNLERGGGESFKGLSPTRVFHFDLFDQESWHLFCKTSRTYLIWRSVLGGKKKISTSSIGVEFYWSYFYSRILCANAQWKSQRKMTASDNPAIVKLGKKIKRDEKKKLLIIIIEKKTNQY